MLENRKGTEAISLVIVIEREANAKSVAATHTVRHDVGLNIVKEFYLVLNIETIDTTLFNMSSYSCISCRVSFADSEIQRIHYKCDWHRYNLKRKVAELPPITQEVFEEKLVQQRNQQLEENKNNSRFCNLCSKPFSSQNAYTNHLKSKKHKFVESKKVRSLHIKKDLLTSLLSLYVFAVIETPTCSCLLFDVLGKYKAPNTLVWSHRPI